MIAVTVPIKIVSVANVREHWAAKAKRTSIHRDAAKWALVAGFPRLRPLPCTVTLTRIAPRELDCDNLRSAFKATRDGVADWLGVDDRSLMVKWEYGQEKGAPKTYAARIEVVPA